MIPISPRSVCLKFFKVNGQEINDLTGFLIMDSEIGPRVSIVLTFWKDMKSMTVFYNKENRIMTRLANELKPLFSEMPCTV
jgi:hypothetical protein